MDTLTPKQREELIYLSENKNVILTPHVGGITKDSNRKLAEVIAKKLLRWMDN
jgi:phosphoglycerate dehydrogenase-like enzyme